MKKTVKMTFAALTAALLAGSAMAAPVCAAAPSPVGYVLGDYDMDGEITLYDALDVLRVYNDSVLLRMPNAASEAEMALGNVMYDPSVDPGKDSLDLGDALAIAQHYTAQLLSGGKYVSWEGVFREDLFETFVLSLDRGAYKLVFDETAGDYVIAEK
ncbi:MAG TPA: hypothetical protein DDX71_00025 [Ruminococcus sp.]|nr:hypothetical protein [Ruminococcus sp.]